jgi:UDP-3-O-[3-hydroxymyristoyl] glucosamine N-acyltransferase
MAGSSTLGRGVIIAARAGVGDHVHVGDQAVLTAMTLVNRDIPPDTMWASARIPRSAVEHGKLELTLGKLPEALKTLGDIEKRLTALEEQIERENA